jgi:glutaredoxin
MTNKRKIEVFTAGCTVCEETVQLVNQLACPSCDVEVLNTQEAASAERAKAYGIRSLPAVVVDGKVADCCSGRGPDEGTLRGAGIGTPL